MDKGAHYFCCDFQVHSPRDKQWTGRKFGVDRDKLTSLSEEDKAQIKSERIQFAKEYLAKIRSAGINSVAITDHHDIVFSKIIRSIAEVDNREFKEAGVHDKFVTVFPGVELTLSNPACQCLLIFDSDFADENLDKVISFLGIDPTSEFEKSTIETSRISQDVIGDLVQFHKKLDELTYCKGRYTIFPNVGDGGKHSILRQGFHEHYRKMPCVGGYVDQAISTDTGYVNKTSGGDVNYGNKSIGIISTSDNRYEDGRGFGKYFTWVKWAEPTAEALRQACLAKESRISQQNPILPDTYITFVDVTTSKFLGNFTINLNRQYDVFIGGRGTGKSTILEYIRWALCDQTSVGSIEEELSAIERKRQNLIQKTLIAVDGEVRLTMVVNRVPHIIKRHSKSRDVLLKIGDSDFKSVSEDDIRRLVPVQAYSQKQLSDVGVKTDELKRFIHRPIAYSLDTIQVELRNIGAGIRSSYSKLLRKKEISNEINIYSLEIESLNSQLKGLRGALVGVSTSDQDTINRKSKVDLELSIVNQVNENVRILQAKTEELSSLTNKISNPFANTASVENEDIVEELKNNYQSKITEVKTTIEILKNSLVPTGLEGIATGISSLQRKRETFLKTYEEVRTKGQANQKQLSEIEKIENRLSEIDTLLIEKRTTLTSLGDPEKDFKESRDRWKAEHITKLRLLNAQAAEFSTLSKNLIRAEISSNVDFRSVRSVLKSLFEGTRIQETRIDAIFNFVKSGQDPLGVYFLILEEFRILAETKVTENKLSTPSIAVTLSTNCGFSEDHLLKLCQKIQPEDWLKLATLELDFSPEFWYKTNNQLGDEIPFADASAGHFGKSLSNDNHYLKISHRCN